MRENCVTNFASVNGILLPGISSYSSQNISICSGQSYNIGSSSYSSAGTYIDTIPNVNGCDSVVTTSITISQLIPSSNDSVSICFGQTYNVGNNAYTSTGMYVDTISNSFGCDSIVNTTLTVYPNFTYNNVVSICKGDSYTIGQSTYNNTGLYTDRYTNNNGCDSTIITDLTVVDVTGGVSQSGGYLIANASNGQPPFSYSWSTGDTTSTIPITSNGQYWIVISDVNECESQKYFISVSNLPSSVYDISSNDIRIFPNPTDGLININFSENIIDTDFKIKVLNYLGEVVFEDKNNKVFKINKLAKGMYTIKLVFKNKIVHKNIVVK